MRISLILITIIIIVTTLVGCSNDSGKRLDEDEYSIYENEQEIFALTDIDWFYYTGGEPFSFLNPMRYKWEGHPEVIKTDDTTIYDFSGKELSTKRGLEVGDTLRQFAEKYPDISISLPDYDISTTPSLLLDKQEEYNIDDTFTVETRTYFWLNGTRKDSHDDVKNDDSYYYLRMKIIFEYNSIKDIEIDYHIFD